MHTDFVLDSSSSSFVLSDMEMFSFFGIGKQDIMDALIDAYGVRDYMYAKRRRFNDARENPTWHCEGLKYGSFGPFYVYDLHDANDRKEAILRWGDSLKERWATNCRWNTDAKGRKMVVFDETTGHRYSASIDAMAQLMGMDAHELRGVANGGSARECLMFTHNGCEPGVYGRYSPIPREMVKTVRTMRRQLGVMTNLDAVRARCARFFVHADGNGLHHGKFSEYGRADVRPRHVDVPCGEWTTERGSFDRVCEVVYGYLVEKGRIVPSDPGFLERMKVEDAYISTEDVESGCIYRFHDGKQLGWADVRCDALTWSMHEE